MEEERVYTKEDYDKEPVHYCPVCMSLNIKILDSNTDYCDDCGNTTMIEASIEDWEIKYEEKYQKKLITLKN